MSHKALFVSNFSDVFVPTIVSLDLDFYLPQRWDDLGLFTVKKMAVIPGIVLSAGTLIFYYRTVLFHASIRQHVD